MKPLNAVSVILVRKGFHAGACPFHLQGVGGPGAPHCFTFVRREDEYVKGFEVDRAAWGQLEAHPLDVLVLNFVRSNMLLFAVSLLI